MPTETLTASGDLVRHVKNYQRLYGEAVQQAIKDGFVLSHRVRELMSQANHEALAALGPQDVVITLGPSGILRKRA
ncbi:MAG: hypothetical protein Q7S11_00160 [bacterium]|nr:hypothetical protein [bacterium]